MGVPKCTSAEQLQVFSRTISTGRRSSRSRSRHGTRLPDDDDPEYSGLRRPGDYKTRQVFKGRQLFFLAYQSIGVIYGDIGTSPLYVYSSVFVDTPPKRDDVRRRQACLFRNLN